MKKGFTLIELLAVIIILAVIALITTPIVMDVIDDSKESGSRSSVAMYADAIELQVTTDWFKNGSYPSVNKTWADDNVEYSGNRVTCEEIYYDATNGVLLHKCTVGNDVSYLNNIKVYAESKVYCYYKKEVYEDCEENITYMANYNSVKSNAPLPNLYRDNSGANQPNLLDNMVAIKYVGNNWVIANTSEKWYDYDNKEWANAVILNSGINKSVGDTLDVATEVSQMYVWIPRYKYILFNSNNGSVPVQEIDVQFETGTAKTGTVTCTNAISSYTKNSTSNKSENCQDKNGTITDGVSTYTHPAFTLNGNELTGIWVGKFEVSSTIMDTCTAKYKSIGTDCDLTTGQIRIKPNVTSWGGVRINTLYKSISNLYIQNGMINADTHMMKNMEWGAVAYFKQSKYGLSITNIGINNNTSYITGCGALPNDSESNVCDEYDTINGKLASTTGNIYGVYDMSGGAHEYVMGNAAKNNELPIVGYNATMNSGFIGKYYDGTTASGTSAVYTLDTKYTDMYSYNSISGPSEFGRTNHSRGKLGDATKEVLSTLNNIAGAWNGDNSSFLYSYSSWFMRGGYSNSSNYAGIFSFTETTGCANTGVTTRVVLSQK